MNDSELTQNIAAYKEGGELSLEARFRCMEIYCINLNERVELLEKLVLSLSESVVDVPLPDHMQWKHKALTMRIAGHKVNGITEAVGKSRQAVSNYLNQPEIKEQWSK